MNRKVCSPIIEIITTVVMVANLLLILGSRVDDNLRNQIKENVFEEFRREVEVSPIVAELQNIEDIAWKMTCQLELKPGYCQERINKVSPLKSILPSK